MIVSTRNLCKGYAEPILHDINIDIAQGEIVLLLGQSGSGKSTLLNLIAGLQHADSGEIYVADQRLDQMDDQRSTLLRRRHIGFIYQQFNLIPTLTVMENLLLPIHLNKLPNGLAKARELLAAVSLENKEDRLPESLSGGEQQRVAICRALIHQPKLILADEPTGNLDNMTASNVIKLMFNQFRAHRQTLLIVSHNEQLIDQVDRCYQLHNGSLMSL